MGRRSHEAQIYQSSHILRLRASAEYPREPPMSPQPRVFTPTIPVESLPPDWAFIEHPEPLYVALCTWGDCANGEVLLAEDLWTPGKQLLLSGLPWEQCLDYLREHLERHHGIRQAEITDPVGFLDPYGLLFQIENRTEPYWK